MFNSYQIYSAAFVVDERPFCLWDKDLPRKNLEFINSIDADYFAYVADTHTQTLQTEGESLQRASLALRMTYSHALETHFALLCAALQAPNCVLGWMLKYQLDDVRSLLTKISKRQKIKNRLELQSISWETIANTFLRNLQFEDKTREQTVRKSFANLWKRLAIDFLDEGMAHEYNSIKHGMRIRSGGFHLAAGIEEIAGQPAPQKSMHSFGGSEFGSSFSVAQKIGKNPYNFYVESHMRNWHPQSFAAELTLISWSITNIVSFLKIVNGVEAKTVPFVWHSDPDTYSAPWKVAVGPHSFVIKLPIPDKGTNWPTKEQILQTYPDSDGQLT